MKLYAWIPSSKPVNGAWKDSCRDRLGASNSDLAYGRVRQRLDIFNSRPEFVESGLCPLQESGAINRQLHSSRCAVKQRSCDGMLECTDRLRNGRLSHSEMASRFAH